MTPFEIRDRVRWSDCDPLGIIYYGAYLRFIEIAEHEMFRASGMPFSELRRNPKVGMPRRAMEAQFESPAELDEELLVRVHIKKIGTTSITMFFDILRASDELRRATATLTVVCVSRPEMTKLEIPAEVRAALQPF